MDGGSGYRPSPALRVASRVRSGARQSSVLASDRPHHRLPGFLQTAVGLASGGDATLLYRKGGESWYEDEDAPIGNHIIDRVLAALGVPRDFAGALSFESAEWRDLYLLISTFFVWGWSVGEDLYIIPKNGSCMLMTSHHGELFAMCPTVAALARFEAEMAKRDYRAR